MKKLINFLKPILVLIGLILIFDKIVFPGLSAANTITNMLSLTAGIIALYFAYHFCIQYYFPPVKEIELTEQEQANIIEYIKNKGVYREPIPKTKNKQKQIK